MESQKGNVASLNLTGMLVYFDMAVAVLLSDISIIIANYIVMILRILSLYLMRQQFVCWGKMMDKTFV